MIPRVVILTEIIAPYRIPVFNALAWRDDVSLHVIFLSETDASLRQWNVYKDEIRFSYEVLPAWRKRMGKYNLLLNGRVSAALRAAKPDILVCGGYSYLASWQAAWWAKRNRVPLLLWSESTAVDARNKRFPVEFMKRKFLHSCRAFVAAGKTSRDYLLALGAAERAVFIAPDAVDVKFYAAQAEAARLFADQLRRKHDLPLRYFLCVGRLIEEKGVLDLLAAYATLDATIRSQIGLVFVGDGPLRSELSRRAGEIVPGTVKVNGWVHREHISEIYALAEALVFPTHSDPWGLVVNEAMACGLPIIASEVGGCVPDLVQDEWNGWVVPSGCIRGLTCSMQKIFERPELRERMRLHSRERIQEYTPEKWAEGLMQAIRYTRSEAA
jgi:glycosyltransferase involved in cell wall biosynthesis